MEERVLAHEGGVVGDALRGGAAALRGAAPALRGGPLTRRGSHRRRSCAPRVFCVGDVAPGVWMQWGHRVHSPTGVGRFEALGESVSARRVPAPTVGCRCARRTWQL